MASFISKLRYIICTHAWGQKILKNGATWYTYRMVCCAIILQKLAFYIKFNQYRFTVAKAPEEI